MGKLKISENDGIHRIYNEDAASNANMIRKALQIIGIVAIFPLAFSTISAIQTVREGTYQEDFFFILMDIFFLGTLALLWALMKIDYGGIDTHIVPEKRLILSGKREFEIPTEAKIIVKGGEVSEEYASYAWQVYVELPTKKIRVFRYSGFRKEQNTIMSIANKIANLLEIPLENVEKEGISTDWDRQEDKLTQVEKSFEIQEKNRWELITMSDKKMSILRSENGFQIQFKENTPIETYVLFYFVPFSLLLGLMLMNFPGSSSKKLLNSLGVQPTIFPFLVSLIIYSMVVLASFMIVTNIIGNKTLRITGYEIKCMMNGFLKSRTLFSLQTSDIKKVDLIESEGGFDIEWVTSSRNRNVFFYDLDEKSEDFRDMIERAIYTLMR
jgi:hypothetical protein